MEMESCSHNLSTNNEHTQFLEVNLPNNSIYEVNIKEEPADEINDNNLSETKNACIKCGENISLNQEVSSHQCLESEQKNITDKLTGLFSEFEACEVKVEPDIIKSEFYGSVDNQFEDLLEPKSIESSMLLGINEHEVLAAESNLNTTNTVTSFDCDKCNDRFSSEWHLANHVHNKHLYPPTRADSTLNIRQKFIKKFIENYYLIQENPVIKKNYTCETCSKTFDEKHAFYKHVKFVHLKIKNFSCTFCNKKFCAKDKLINHENTVHRKLKKFPCDQCEKTFAYKHHVKDHVKAAHTLVRDVSCNYCNKMFAHSYVLNKHVQSVHLKIRNKKFSCTICSYKSDCSFKVKRHERSVHQKIKDFSCNVCNRKFSRKDKLNDHVKAHENIGNKGFACEICNKKISRKYNLVKHIATVHKQPKNYGLTCDNCGRKFCHKSTLISHLSVVHKNAKKFSCDNCGQSYSYKRTLIRHLATVHRNSSKFSCNNCGKNFLYKRTLVVHLESCTIEEEVLEEYFSDE